MIVKLRHATRKYEISCESVLSTQLESVRKVVFGLAVFATSRRRQILLEIAECKAVGKVEKHTNHPNNSNSFHFKDKYELYNKTMHINMSFLCSLS
jgi:hypothetical protein